MDAVDLTAINTGTFIARHDVSAWAENYPLAAGLFRAHMRVTAGDPVIQYEWSTANGRILYTESPARGSVTFATNPAPNDMLIVGTTVVTFVASGATGLEVNIGVSLTATLTALLSFLSASTDAQIELCSYALSALTLNLAAKTPGVSGNSIALSCSTSGATTAPMDGGAHFITLIGPLSETEGFLGEYAYDCRLEYQATQFIPLFGGTLTFTQGVTREPSDATILADTIPSAAYAATQPSLFNMLVYG